MSGDYRSSTSMCRYYDGFLYSGSCFLQGMGTRITAKPCRKKVEGLRCLAQQQIPSPSERQPMDCFLLDKDYPDELRIQVLAVARMDSALVMSLLKAIDGVRQPTAMTRLNTTVANAEIECYIC
ncbi:MAG: hypothetical protein ACKPKO_50265, partial [Candidatus Fonsibacter sp.]